MDFFEMVQKLQIIYQSKILLISCGGFYVAIGADAIMLNEKLGLKLSCAKKGLCKVGVPKNSIDKYIKKLDEISYSYIIIDYEKDRNELIKKIDKQGNNVNKTKLNNDCSTCNNIRYVKKTKYDKAFKTYVNSEFGEDVVW